MCLELQISPLSPQKMYRSSLVLAVCIAICCINTISADSYGIDCECICCKEQSINSNCTVFMDSFIHLELEECDLNKCQKECEDTYKQCGEHTGTKLLVDCTKGTPGPSSTTPQTSSSDTTATESPVTVSTTSENISSTTTTDAKNTTVTVPSSTTTPVPSSANTFKSIFQMSHVASVGVLLTFLWW